MEKKAVTKYPLKPCLSDRWSPYAFDAKPVSKEDLGALFEAARWAPSCFNEQPWRFLVATSEDAEAHARIADCLVDFNKSWAQHAPVLVVTIASHKFSRNGNDNRHAAYDLGMAVGGLLAQATALGLVAHQMGGFSIEKATETLEIPTDFEPLAVMALGYQGSADTLPEGLAQREAAVRERRELNEIVFGSTWQSASPLS